MVFLKDSINDFSRILLVEGIVADFALEESYEIAARLFGIEYERIFALCSEFRIVAIQVPVTTGYGILLVNLGGTHAGLDAVVDAG